MYMYKRKQKILLSNTYLINMAVIFIFYEHDIKLVATHSTDSQLSDHEKPCEDHSPMLRLSTFIY